MIRLWIISLNHCFPLLHWLGAIHLPPPPESQTLVNCLSCSLLFFLFYPLPSQTQSQVTIFICPPLLSSIYGRASCAAASASAVCLWTHPKWGNTSPHSAVLTRWPFTQYKWDNKSIMLFLWRSREMPWCRVTTGFSAELHPDWNNFRNSSHLLHLSTHNVLELKVCFQLWLCVCP